jgi:hypothetical protein
VRGFFCPGATQCHPHYGSGWIHRASTVEDKSLLLKESNTLTRLLATTITRANRWIQNQAIARAKPIHRLAEKQSYRSIPRRLLPLQSILAIFGLLAIPQIFKMKRKNIKFTHQTFCLCDSDKTTLSIQLLEIQALLYIGNIKIRVGHLLSRARYFVLMVDSYSWSTRASSERCQS